MYFKYGTTAFIGIFVLSLLVCAEKELTMSTVKAGDCSRRAKSGDSLSMHYTGKLEDGTEFDSSYPRGSPLDLLLGSGMVIKGWDEGIVGMCKGEIRKLIIPPHMAYGKQGYPPAIPPEATLHFDVELVDFKGEGDQASEDEL